MLPEWLEDGGPLMEAEVRLMSRGCLHADEPVHPAVISTRLLAVEWFRAQALREAVSVRGVISHDSTGFYGLVGGDRCHEDCRGCAVERALQAFEIKEKADDPA